MRQTLLNSVFVNFSLPLQPSPTLYTMLASVFLLQIITEIYLVREGETQKLMWSWLEPCDRLQCPEFFGRFCHIPKSLAAAHLPDVWGLRLLLKKVKIVKFLPKQDWGSKKSETLNLSEAI